jgi:hypothetical protein
MIVCLYLIHFFLISHYIGIHLCNSPSRCCLESDYHFLICFLIFIGTNQFGGGGLAKGNHTLRHTERGEEPIIK